MAKLIGWRSLAGIFKNEPPKSPWGNGGGSGGGSGGGDGGGSGPRNPWSFPPDGRRPRPGAATTLDELLKRARSGGGGGGIPGLPAGNRLWLILVGALLLVWILFTSIHPIGPRERGVVTTLGSYAGTLEPGFRMTLPAPFQSVQKVDVANIRTENFPVSGENLMLTGDQNIVDLAYSVRWDIRSAPDYVFQIARPTDTVRATAESAMRAVVATTSLNEAIGNGRARMEGQVQASMQEILDQYNSGIRIQGVAIQKAAAPQAVDEDFKQVTAAQQEAQANKNNANAYAQQVLAAAQGEAAEFDKIYEQYRLAPEVTRRRLYYETMEAVLARTDKTIVEAPGVTPYLPIPGLQRRAEPAPAAAPSPAPTAPAQPRTQGGATQ
ncbi:protease modulator HflK [Sphingomonas sp. M1-B02]|uniref:protease modulator HflK n=1 Tax=Sphingomonas sp. M1-B02 TaxID=3114300 RepID=UPI002240E07F|nr:protease modulator HflK [Sphingomonas sp. S6-11]UZK65647.1 protease modulator HflK [Sphingomonas sp. S6-11]